MSLPEIAADLTERGWRLHVARPRDPGHLLLTVRRPGSGADADGTHEAVGQWWSDPARAASAAARIRAIAPPGVAVERIGAGIVVQPGGADRRLQRLAGLVAEPGARLVAHRPERRAVVRRTCPDAAAGVVFTKVVRDGHGAALSAGLRGLRARGVPVPQVRGAETGAHSAGDLVELAALPGRTLFEIGASSDEARDLGRMLRRLHRVVPDPAAPRHDAAAEIAVTERWLDLAAAYGLDPDPRRRRLRSAAAAVVAVPAPARPAALHRDLHDKQLLLDADGAEPWSVLDLDLLSAGDPALDLANLSEHLRLRSRQSGRPGDAAAATAERVLDGWGADRRTRAAVDAYAALTRLRLDAVYAFRPGGE